VERILIDSSAREIKSMEIGQHLMKELRKIDKVAYVRFASVYLDFKDVREFMDEISHLVKPS
jgi:transcriptional repressor NrdR